MIFITNSSIIVVANCQSNIQIFSNCNSHPKTALFYFIRNQAPRIDNIQQLLDFTKNHYCMLQLYVFFMLLILLGCGQHAKQTTEPQPQRWLEDIAFDANLDNPDFVVCNGEKKIYQYFNIGDNISIEGDKPYILEHFAQGYQPKQMPKESGLIRIRFIVNCQGKTDRFRILESDLNYQPKTFDKKISQRLLQLSQSLQGWQPKINEGKPVDYYQYLIFRIENGQLIKILP